jgi:hypothetical protein
MEARLHSRADVRKGKRSAVLKGAQASLRATFAADVPCELGTATTAPTTPGNAATLLRWCTAGRLQHCATLATLLTPGRRAARLRVDSDSRRIVVRAACADWQRNIVLTRHLAAPRPGSRKRKEN